MVSCLRNIVSTRVCGLDLYVLCYMLAPSIALNVLFWARDFRPMSGTGDQYFIASKMSLYLKREHKPFNISITY